jgi:PAS domain S-box-containing protein
MLDLEKSELKYRNLYENVNDMIFSLDENGYFIAINCRIELYGYKAEEMIGEHFTSLLSPNNRQFFLDRFEQVKIAKDNLQNVYETEIIKKDNTLAIAELSISTIYKDAEFIGRFGIARDITGFT